MLECPNDNPEECSNVLAALKLLFLCLSLYGRKQYTVTGLLNQVSEWPAEHHRRSESPWLQLRCVLWHSRDGVVGHRHPFGNAICTMPRRFKSKSCWNASQLFSPFCQQVVQWQRGRNLQRIVLLLFKQICFFWMSQVGSHLERPTPPNVRFGGALVHPSFVSCYDVRREGLLPSNFLASGCTCPPCPVSALLSVYGPPPTGATMRRFHNIMYFSSFGSFLIRDSTFEKFS